MTRIGVDRVMEYAFVQAEKRRKKVTSATKSNGISITMPYWDTRFEAIQSNHPGIETNQFHIDILTAHFVQHPEWFDVVVASNLFGDILSDLGPACTGTVGVAPSANINPTGDFPSLFEPVHGSAPDIAGKGVANPIGQIWSGAMMLDHLGSEEAGADIEEAIDEVLSAADPTVLTPDVGGQGHHGDTRSSHHRRASRGVKLPSREHISGVARRPRIRFEARPPTSSRPAITRIAYTD
jgi:tartrate dehydrogenase/decarboxylase/D-malate dehydrogenase